ncbi:hypothetical protein CGRA01v4_11061 [Colletotrichum graminicola]|nr:hypothetical protein CGRA01v4_11061 [Colletotrichum graminicola]
MLIPLHDDGVGSFACPPDCCSLFIFPRCADPIQRKFMSNHQSYHSLDRDTKTAHTNKAVGPGPDTAHTESRRLHQLGSISRDILFLSFMIA